MYIGNVKKPENSGACCLDVVCEDRVLSRGERSRVVWPCDKKVRMRRASRISCCVFLKGVYCYRVRSLTGSGNVMIGYKAGYYEIGSNKLYIDNSNTTTPLIYGDFANDSVKINGQMEINIGLLADADLDNSDNYPLKIGSDEWLYKQVTGIEFWNGYLKEVPSSRIVSQMAGNGDEGEDLIFQTQSSCHLI